MTTFSDLDLHLTKLNNGDINVITDDNAIKQALRNILLTNNYERPFLNNNMTADIRGLLFELVTPANAIILQHRIENAIKLYEPRIELISVTVKDDIDNNGYNCIVKYAITKLSLITQVSIFLERIR